MGHLAQYLIKTAQASPRHTAKPGAKPVSYTVADTFLTIDTPQMINQQTGEKERIFKKMRADLGKPLPTYVPGKKDLQEYGEVVNQIAQASRRSAEGGGNINDQRAAGKAAYAKNINKHKGLAGEDAVPTAERWSRAGKFAGNIPEQMRRSLGAQASDEDAKALANARKGWFARTFAPGAGKEEVQRIISNRVVNAPPEVRKKVEEGRRAFLQRWAPWAIALLGAGGISLLAARSARQPAVGQQMAPGQFPGRMPSAWSANQQFGRWRR